MDIHDYIMNIYGYISYTFLIYFLNMFHVFSLVCFLIYGVNRVGPDMAEVRVLCIPLEINDRGGIVDYPTQYEPYFHLWVWVGN